MASTPSASALSAVLRCRGNILARNPPNKRPASSAYSLGLSDSPVERSRSEQASAWEAFLRGERVVVRRGLTVRLEPPGRNDKGQSEGDSRGMNKLYHSKLSQHSRDARAAALVRQLARALTPNQPVREKHCEIIHMSRSEGKAAHVFKVVSVEESGGSQPGVFRVSIRVMEMKKAAQIQALLVSGWSAVRRTFSSLFVCLKLCRSSSSPDSASEHLQSLEEKQAKGQTQSRTGPPSMKNNTGSGQRITGDRPD